MMRGFCPRGFCPEGAYVLMELCMEGVLSKGVLSEGVLSEGVLSGGGFVLPSLVGQAFDSHKDMDSNPFFTLLGFGSGLWKR